MNTLDTVREAKRVALMVYRRFEELKDILSDLSEDNNLTEFERKAFLNINNELPDVELLDELIARLGCITLKR